MDSKQRSGRSDSQKNEVRPYNDVSWWFNDPALARDAASIWFTQRLGTPIPSDTARAATEVGGIMAVHFVPTYGVTGDVDPQGRGAYDTSAINVAAMKVYWDVVHANSRNTSYEASDLMRFFICMDNIYMMIQDAVRAYALAAKYSTVNPYIGRALIQACDWDPNAILSNIANFRYRLNRLIAQVNRIHVPRLYNLFEAHNAVLSRVFMDGDSVKAQLYVCVPNGYYTYDDATGRMSWVNADSLGSLATVNHKIKDVTYLDTIEARIGEVLGSEYMGVMDGDILKRYGAEVMYRIPEVEEDEDIEFVWDDEFNLMLANANFLGVPTVNSTGGLCNTPGVYMEQPETATQFLEIQIVTTPSGNDGSDYKWNWDGNDNTIVINFPDDTPATPENLMLATRMRFLRNGDGDIVAISSVGTLLGCYCKLWTFSENNQLTSRTTIWQLANNLNDYALGIIAANNQYAVCPRLLVRRATGGQYQDLGKVDNFGFVTRDSLDKFNYVAITSIFTEISKNAGSYGVPAYKQR